MKVRYYYTGIKVVEKEIPDKFATIPQLLREDDWWHNPEKEAFVDEYEKYSETVWKEIEKAEEKGHPWQSYFCHKMGVYTADEREDFLEEY